MAPVGSTSAAAKSNPQSRPRISSSSPMFATIIVGEDEERFVVHESLLTHYSGFFRAALTGNFKEADNKTVTLEKEDPTTFEFFVHWLYYQDFPDQQKNDDKELTKKFYYNGYPDDGAIVKLYVFADKYETAGLRRATVDLLFCTMVNHEETQLPYGATCEYAFEHLPATSPMCRLLVDLFCHYELVEYDRHEFTDLAFLLAIWQRYVHFRRNKDQDVDEGLKLCDYHEHTSEGDREACEKDRDVEEEGSG